MSLDVTSEEFIWTSVDLVESSIQESLEVSTLFYSILFYALLPPKMGKKKLKKEKKRQLGLKIVRSSSKR